MATKTKGSSNDRKSTSLSLGAETASYIEREAQRLGIPKSHLVERIVNNQANLEENDSRPTIISVMSYKGGVAKTTTSTCLAVCLAEEGHRVLIIDMDGQGNASQYMGVYDPRSEEACIADVLYSSSAKAARLSLDDVMKETKYENVYVVPSNFRFADADARMKAEGAGADTRLRYAIEDMEQTFDYIIIDCGPRLDMTTTNAIVALEAGNSNSHLILPVRVDGFAIAGVSQTVAMINRTAADRRTQPQPWRILQTMVEPRTSAYKAGVEELKAAVPNARYFTTKISKSTVVPESSLVMTPLVTYDPTSKPTLEYRMLAGEIEALNG